MSDISSEYTLSIELECRDYRGAVFPFVVNLNATPLEHLVQDAFNAYRVYELFSVQRPGDICNYTWVQLIDVPEAVQTRYQEARTEAGNPFFGECDWPDKFLPLTIFETFFGWYGDDTDPESECWLQHREGNLFKTFADKAFTCINQSQEALRKSNDPLILDEISQLESNTHLYDYLAEPPRQLTALDYESVAHPQLDETYYRKLEELLKQDDIQSVAYRANFDHHSVLLICGEQMQRSKRLNQTPSEAFEINALCWDSPLYEIPWQSNVNWYYEGIGYGDLRIEQSFGGGASVRELIEDHQSSRFGPYIFSTQDEGELAGFTKESGDGWFLYKNIDINKETFK